MSDLPVDSLSRDLNRLYSLNKTRERYIKLANEHRYLNDEAALDITDASNILAEKYLKKLKAALKEIAETHGVK